MFHKSIRWRIQAWHGLLLLCLVTGMLTAFYLYARAERFRLIDNQLQSLLTPLLPKVTMRGGPGFGDEGPPPGPERPPRRHRDPSDASDRSDFPELKSGLYYFAFRSPDGEILRKSSGAPSVLPPESSGQAGEQYFRTHHTFRELVFFGPDGSCMIVGSSTSEASAEIHRLALVLMAIGFGIVAFGLVGGWWVAGHALRPIGEISATARQISSGNRAKRIDVRDTESELGQLAEVLNKTFDRQDAAFEQQVRFTADASHELRTPVSVILTHVQLALSREREPEEYRESLRICQRAAERMRSLVNSLLELARVDSGEFQLKMEECDLGALAMESLELVAPLAHEKNAVVTSSIQRVRTRADSAKIGQVVVNLLYNAIQHNANGVEIRLSVRAQDGLAVLCVADNGAGIPADALPHVFERFFRADKSRTGSKNGAGLGLAISHAIVQAHGGTIRAESPAGQGAVFTVSLPLVG